MSDRKPNIIGALTAAQEWLIERHGFYLRPAPRRKGDMPQHRPTVFSLVAWFSSLFMRDGRPLEFMSGGIILGWAWVSDILTDRKVVTSSMDGAMALIEPSHLVAVGYALGASQLIALMTLKRRFRAPTAFLASIFLGILTAGVWKGALAPALPFYIAIWAANGYVFVRLCRPKP